MPGRIALVLALVMAACGGQDEDYALAVAARIDEARSLAVDARERCEALRARGGPPDAEQWGIASESERVAEEHALAGRAPEAVAAFARARDAYARASWHASARLARRQAKERAAETEAALERARLTRAVLGGAQVDPRNLEEPDRLLAKAGILIRGGKHDLARKTLGLAEEKLSRIAIGLREETMRRRAGDAQAAVERAERWLSERGLDTRTLAAAHLHLERGRRLAPGPENAPAYEAFDAARAAAEAVIEAGPALLAARSGAQEQRNAATREREQWERVARDLDPASREEGATAWAALRRADSAFASGDFDGARKAYLEAARGSARLTGRYAGRVPPGWELVNPAAGDGGWARAVLDPRSRIVFVRIAPGRFKMGVPGQFRTKSDFISHEVTLTRGFYLARTEVTLAQWFRFAGDADYVSEAEGEVAAASLDPARKIVPETDASWMQPFPARPFVLEPEHPVTCLTLADAEAFCVRFGYRLPTEAEWEYACRAGTTSRFWWGEGPSQGRANILDLDDKHPLLAPVASATASPWGLHDMLGNVREICADRFEIERKPLQARTDPLVEPGGRERVCRGGHFLSSKTERLTTLRSPLGPHAADAWTGFRVAFDPEARR